MRRIALLRRVLLVALSVLLHDPALRAQLLSSACLLLLLLHIALQPFRSRLANLQVTSLCFVAALVTESL
jgi:hypothetical protein